MLREGGIKVSEAPRFRSSVPQSESIIEKALCASQSEINQAARVYDENYMMVKTRFRFGSSCVKEPRLSKM